MDGIPQDGPSQQPKSTEHGALGAANNPKPQEEAMQQNEEVKFKIIDLPSEQSDAADSFKESNEFRQFQVIEPGPNSKDSPAKASRSSEKT